MFSLLQALAVEMLLEALKINHDGWWRPLPDYVRERTRFYNIPAPVRQWPQLLELKFEVSWHFQVNETMCDVSMEQGVYAERGSFLGI